MSFDGDERNSCNNQWKCGGKVGPTGVATSTVKNLQKVSSIVRDIGEPCLAQSPIKISKMLKPEKWQAVFDSKGKIFGFQKVLKLIIYGGIDPSIRPEVWEFLLGCYALSSTTEYRRQLRTARRERYRDLVRQCQLMHSSVGTGSLAYVVGSKVMDMRTSSRDDQRQDNEGNSMQTSDNSASKLERYCDRESNCTDTFYPLEKDTCSDSGDLVSVRGSTDGVAYDDCCSIPNSGPENFYDFPPLPVTDLFQKSEKGKTGPKLPNNKYSTPSKPRVPDNRMYSFEITNNADLIVESSSSPNYEITNSSYSEVKLVHPDMRDSVSLSSNKEYVTKMLDGLRISDAPEAPATTATTSHGEAVGGDRVSEWLWTLHRIVVDVVRTDSHLEFYEDTRNLARMSDILAVYAWVDPATGYCQGMSDLLSPFVVLFEDNADAFWCFEMLLRRMRENFRMEGPTGVMKQLQALWHILELTDREMFTHLSEVGAESLHFAFRMLLVLFRRELSFNEALCMWEMIWAADFKESLACELEEICPELLLIQFPRGSSAESGEEDKIECNNGDSSGDVATAKEQPNSDNNGIKAASAHTFCGLTKQFWSKNDRMHICTVISSTRNGDDELPVFCVAAILIMNRQKIIRETHSIDDLIKIFNDNILKIRVKRCVRTAIKLRKKYFYKLIRCRSPARRKGD